MYYHVDPKPNVVYVDTYTPPVTPVLYTPRANHVALAAIPYTGLDLGSTGDSIYWGAIVAFAGSMLYLLVYFKRNAFGK
jgi:hypothetical protein